MSSISFPPRSHSPESSSSTEHINAFRSAYSTTSSSSFQINPLSHHPPRTPRTSTFSSSQSQSPSSHSHSHSRTISQPSSFRSQNAYDYTTDVYASHSHPSATGPGLEGAGVGSGEIPGPNDDEKQMLKNLDIEVEEDAVVPDVDVEASLTVQAREKVWSAEVWREMLKSVRGRDKAFKLIQYTLRVYLLFHRAASSSAILRSASSRTKWSIDFKLAKRFEDTASGLSLTRKCLILFDWLDPLTSILSSQPLEFSLESKEDLAASIATTSQAQGAKQPTKPLLHAFLRAPPPVLLDLVHAMSDDVYCMSRLGLLGKRTGERAGRFSDWCWFAATLIALVELSFERTVTKSKLQAAESRLYKATMRGGSGVDASNSSAVAAAELELVRLRRQDFWLKVQRTKLLMDLVFVCYDVFKLKRARDTVKTFAGLASAVLSSAKIYHSHKTALVLKAMQR